MAVSFGQTGLADPGDSPAESEYLECVDLPALQVRIHLDAVDGIAHDVMEGVKALPRRGAEIGGLLLGTSSTAGPALVSVDRYQRLECAHRFGPQFAMDVAELEGLERAAASLASGDELTVTGFYRSNTRPGFRIEDSDLEILDRYFPDPGDLALLLQPVGIREIQAQFFMRSESRGWEPAGGEFLFRGRVLGPIGTPDSEPDLPPAPLAVTPAAPEPASSQPQERPRRLVPDFMPAGESPRATYSVPEPVGPPVSPDTEPSPSPKRWWPLACAVALVGGALYFFIQSQESSSGKDAAVAAPQAETAAPARPLGLYVDPSGDAWRISWNTGATSLQRARNVALFVREGEDQNRIDLAARDLQSGTYQYQPRSDAGPARDVTFRIEVTDDAGRLSAESFRLMRTAPAAPPPAAATALPPPAQPQPAAAHPRALKKVPPVVPAGIRPRIHGSIPVDVRVSIDQRGRVASAVPVAKPHGGLQTFLASRAVAAARQWRFEPGPGSEVIHFVFEK